LSGIPSFYTYGIQFEEQRTLEEAIAKSKYLCKQNKGRVMALKSWRDKKNDKVDQRKKGFKPTFFRNTYNSYRRESPRWEDLWGKEKDNQSSVGAVKENIGT